jgi:hypothetical protein
MNPLLRHGMLVKHHQGLTSSWKMDGSDDSGHAAGGSSAGTSRSARSSDSDYGHGGGGMNQHISR